MKFLASVSALAAFAASVLAQTEGFDPIYTPEKGAELTAGQTFEVTWGAPAEYSSDTISIHLIGGATQKTQIPLADLASGIPNSQKTFTWAVDASLGAEKYYGLVIKLESNPAIFQYSNPFHIVKSGGSYETGYGQKTTTVSKEYGIKTVTLSSVPPTSTSCTTTSTPPPVSTPIYTPPVYPINSTSTYILPPTQPTEPTYAPAEPTTTGPAEVPDVPGSGARFAASSVALAGAIFVAAFAL